MIYTITLQMVDPMVNVLVEIIDVVTIAIIFGSFSYAIVQLVQYHLHRSFGRPRMKGMKIKKIRIQLGEYLLLALEIFICADIILSVQDPSIEHLTQLAIIIVLRIMIAYFLQHEIRELGKAREIKESYE